MSVSAISGHQLEMSKNDFFCYNRISSVFKTGLFEQPLVVNKECLGVMFMNYELLKEERIHGMPKYPLSIYHQEDLTDENILDCHWHDELEILQVTEGKAIFQIGTQSYEVCKGQALFINSGEIHSGHQCHPTCSFKAIVFNSDLIASSSYDAIQENYICPLVNKQIHPLVHLKGNEAWERETLERIAMLFEVNESMPPFFELMTKSNLLLILTQLLQHSEVENDCHRHNANDSSMACIKDALTYIQMHYDEPLRLHDISQHINMSEGHFCRFFKQVTRKTPFQYITQYRVQVACRLLEEETGSIVDIAMRSGFENPSYFTTVFKKKTGLSPSQYRKNPRISILN